MRKGWSIQNEKNFFLNTISLLASCCKTLSAGPANPPSGLFFPCQAMSEWLLPYAILLLKWMMKLQRQITLSETKYRLKTYVNKSMQNLLSDLSCL